MSPITSRCTRPTFGLLVTGALAPFALLPLASTEHWLPLVKAALLVTQLGVLVYALLLLPTKLVISDEGIWQKLPFRECRLRWEDMVEWRHCVGGEQCEEPELRKATFGKWHEIEFWIRDRTGRKHRLKKWLVFGARSKQLADMMRARGIKGG
jgi:hypothetical protein